MIRWLLVAAVVLGPPVIVGLALCRAAARGDCDPDPLDEDVCAGCDGYLEFDDDGASLCMSCGVTRWTP